MSLIAGQEWGEWRAQAACLNRPELVFFPDIGKSLKDSPAVQCCNGCPVRIDCLKYALADPQIVGIWAGTSDEDRKKMRRKGPRTRRAPQPIAHGTEAGAQAHRRNHQKPCEACRIAVNAAQELRREQGPRIEVVCQLDSCGKTFTTRNRADRVAKFCSPECNYKNQSITKSRSKGHH